ncbi:hypothetical protein HPB49_019064 [Dermacentor silvarum]|uniref:Uncharacterized protein n=1 Tax=Dermacentor silvarum TaxID=543639 RepID=A0ACB8D7G0_DERSI|nr:hypothetical protein HPB49_019064 [Dermacentor silvarum]
MDILEATTNQTSRLLKRTAEKDAVMKEANLLRLVRSFILSRITYAIPYLKATKAERDKVDILIWKCVKTALGLPACTSTETILNL